MSLSSRNKTGGRPLVMYHADCPDGFGAAYAAWEFFREKARYVPVPPDNRDIPVEAKNADVYTLDYCFPEDRIRDLMELAKSLTVIDHHVSNEKSARLATHSIFDVNHSGAVLSWMYFHPAARIPKLLEYIEDYDLWRFKLPKTPEIKEAIALRDFDFKAWRKLARELDADKKRRKLVEAGAILLERARRSVERLVSNAEELVFERHKVLMVNSPVYISELGQALLSRGCDIAIIWSRRGKKIIVSLRSDGKVDVSKIAQKYGGGGHKAAAGFSWEVDTFLEFNNVSK